MGFLYLVAKSEKWCKGSKYNLIAQMKVVELLKFGREMLKMLHENGIRMADYTYVPMITDYLDMKERSIKTTYIIARLSRKYGMCERKVYKVLKRLLKEC